MFHRQQGQKSDKSNKALQKQQQTTHTTAQQVNGTHPITLIQRAKLNPNSLNTNDVLRLQQTIGNRAATQLLAGNSGQRVQTKLTIGEPGDKYEIEADRVAAEVVQQMNAPASPQTSQSESVQRQEMEDEELMMKPMVQRQADGGMAATPDLEASINQARGSGQPLADNIRKPMEQAFRADFSGVKVHTDAQSDQLNQSIQARAFTTGQDIFFRQGEYSPGNRGGQELIAHELTHVVQQNQRAVQRSSQLMEKVRQQPTAKPGSPLAANGVIQEKGGMAENPQVSSKEQRPNHTGLPDDLKAGIENLSGMAMDDVTVHYNSPKPAQLQALAYTQGTDIHIVSGEEKHLPHETWHIVQQKQGKVKPTTQMKGVVINDDTSLEKEADLMGGKAAKSTHKNSNIQIKSSSSSTTAIVQRKSGTPLMTQINQSEPLLNWERRQNDHDLQSLFQQIEAYDHSQNGRPSAHLEAVNQIFANLKRWLNEKISDFNENDSKNYNKFIEILTTEIDINQNQADRLNKYTAEPTSPYKQMTDEGMLWSHSNFKDNTKKTQKTGKAYFDELSKMNMESMNKEKPNIFSFWFYDFVKRASQALSSAVVNHYTTKTRADAMSDGGRMKSKMTLEKDLATFKHNTSPYDDLGLGNSGFLFFFIEPPNATLRETRFAEGDDGGEPARISIPIKESGLLTNGWLMLSDFAQREYPDLMTNEKSDKYTSWLPTRKEEQQKNKPEFTQLVRHFERGLAPLEDKDIEEMMKITDRDRRQAFTVVVPQARGDADSKQVYTGPKGQLEVPDRLLNNVLVGKDIIPGLATRAALEVARIKKVNPGLGQSLSELQGNALMLFILKDLFRPQAMIPNSLEITEKNIEF